MSSTPTGLYAGIDVSKGRLETALRPTGERLGFPNDPAGIDALVGRLERASCPKLVVLEATGGFERAVAAALAVAGIPPWR